MRRQVSLLLSNGHLSAREYPLGMVWDESRIVVERVNQSHATNAVLTQLAVASLFSKESAKGFKKQIKGLNSGY